MTEILEVPLVIADQDQADTFLEQLQIDSDRSYSGFRNLESRLTDDKRIYFYLLESLSESDVYSVWDRLIPKAPFCLIIFNWENPEIDSLYDQYKTRYETPVYFVTGKPDEEVDPLNIENEVLKNEFNRVLFFEQQDKNRVQKILKQALQYTLDNDTTEDNINNNVLSISTNNESNN